MTAKNLFSKKESIKTGKFLLGFGASFLALSALLFFVPLEWIEFFFAAATLLLLNALGFAGEIVFGEPVLIQLQALSLPIAITYLCTGLLEAVVVVSAVAASFGIPAKKRIVGVALGLLAIVAFNVVRIVASILIIIFLGLDAGEFSHDLLFRIFLFATIAGYYFFWFRWVTKKNN